VKAPELEQALARVLGLGLVLARVPGQERARGLVQDSALDSGRDLALGLEQAQVLESVMGQDLALDLASERVQEMGLEKAQEKVLA